MAVCSQPPPRRRATCWVQRLARGNLLGSNPGGFGSLFTSNASALGNLLGRTPRPWATCSVYLGRLWQPVHQQLLALGSLFVSNPGGFGSLLTSNQSALASLLGSNPGGFGSLLAINPLAFGTLLSTNPTANASLLASNPSAVASVLGSNPSAFGSLLASDALALGNLLGFNASAFGVLLGSNSGALGNLLGSNSLALGALLGSSPSTFGNLLAKDPSALGSLLQSDPGALGAIIGSNPSGFAQLLGSNASAFGNLLGSNPSALGALMASNPSGFSSLLTSDSTALGSLLTSNSSAFGSLLASDPSLIDSIFSNPANSGLLSQFLSSNPSILTTFALDLTRLNVNLSSTSGNQVTGGLLGSYDIGTGSVFTENITAGQLDLLNQGLAQGVAASTYQLNVTADGGNNTLVGGLMGNFTANGVGNNRFVVEDPSFLIPSGTTLPTQIASTGGTFTGSGGNDTFSFVGGSSGYSFGNVTLGETVPTGQDSIDFSNYLASSGVNIDLTKAGAQVVTPQMLTLTLPSSPGIADVIGSPASDTIIGNNQNNVLQGSSGRCE